MIDFFVENPNYFFLAIGVIADVLVGVIVLIFSFRKKKLNESDRIEVLIDSVLPGYITLAEASESYGSSKLSLVVELVMKKISRYILKKDVHVYRSMIIEKVENILSTPQKKG